MTPTPHHLATLDKFHQWTKELFGAAQPVFSCKHHVNPDGSIELNRGTMRLQFFENGGIGLYDYSQGCVMVVLMGKHSLEETLMAGLQWALQRKFHETYPS